MKKRLSLVLTLALLLLGTAVAEIPNISTLTDDELVELSEAIVKEQANRNESFTKKEIAAEEPAAEIAEPAEQTYEKGSKGEEVKKIQQRLVELNYLEGGADGDFGGKTEAAIKVFQAAAGLDATGAADPATQKALFADDAPKAKVYQKINFKEISRDPNAFTGEFYKFSGNVLQVLEGSSSNGTTPTELRIATKGRYDDVVYVIYYRPDTEKRILEDDKVTVYGMCMGLMSYETIMGGTVTLPNFLAETVSFE